MDAVFVGTTYKAKEMAREAQEWMKSNAPWQDRPSDPETGFVGGRARAGLKVRVVKNEVEEQVYKERMAEAINRDNLLRDQLEEARKKRKESAKRIATGYEEGQKATKTTVRKRKRHKETGEIFVFTTVIHSPAIAPNPRAASRLRYNIRTQKQYKRVRSVPKGRSAVESLKRSWKGEKSPLVDIKFSHNKSLGYPLWLEIANQGKYAIIARAIAYWSPKFMAEVKRIANLVQFQGRIQLGDVSTQQEMFEHHVQAMSDFEDSYKPWDSSPRAKAIRYKNKMRYQKEKTQRAEARAEKQEYLESLKSGGVRKPKPAQNPLAGYETFRLR